MLIVYSKKTNITSQPPVLQQLSLVAFFCPSCAPGWVMCWCFRWTSRQLSRRVVKARIILYTVLVLSRYLCTTKAQYSTVQLFSTKYKHTVPYLTLDSSSAVQVHVPFSWEGRAGVDSRLARSRISELSKFSRTRLVALRKLFLQCPTKCVKETALFR